MLNPLKWSNHQFRRQPIGTLRIVPSPTATREDLEIRNLLDDPNLRRVMGLDGQTPDVARLLEEAAA
jgi:hypothetical protein